MATLLSAVSLLGWLAAGPLHGALDMSHGPGLMAHVPKGMSLSAFVAAPARGKPRPEPPAPAPAPPPAYTAELAQADIDVVLTGRGREYIQARGRLEANPAVAAPLVAARLTATPAPTSVEQRRLLALLGGMARPEDVALFAAALRREVAAAVKQSQEQGIELSAAEPWREILRSQGANAEAAFRDLVADKDFSEELRGLLLGDLVAVTPTEKLPELVALVGLGTPTLRAALRQAIVRRAHASVTERARIVEVVDGALTGGDSKRVPGLLLLRAALGGADDSEFTRRAAALAEDGDAEFPARVAAIRILVARNADAAAKSVLGRLVDQHLTAERRSDQRSEILGSLALGGLDAASAAPRVDRLQLTRAEAPRIAAAAWLVATIPGGNWLDDSQHHAWPEVRTAALTRVDRPCDATILRRLRDGTTTAGATFEPDPAVAREIIAALGRCGGPDAFAALQAVVVDATQGVDRRAEAARQLVDHHGSGGADVVAGVLRSSDDLAVSLRLLRALQRLLDLGPEAAPPSPAVREALCVATKQQELARTAQRVLRGLYPDLESPCTP